MKRKTWVAHMATSNFDFYAMGATEAEAKQAIRKGWDKHAKEWGAPTVAEVEQGGTPFDEHYGIYTVRLSNGECNER